MIFALLLLATIPQRYEPPTDSVDLIECNQVVGPAFWEELIFWELDDGEWKLVDHRVDSCQWRFNTRGDEVWIWDRCDSLAYRVVKAKSVACSVGIASVFYQYRQALPNEPIRGLNGQSPLED